MLKVFIEGNFSDKEFKLPKEEEHHLFTVLRAQPGEIVMVLNGTGTYAIARATSRFSLLVESLHTRPQNEIRLIPAILKSKAMDFLVRESTAIGISEIQPIITERTEVKFNAEVLKSKMKHWTAIAKEACKQSGNPHLPKINFPIKLKDVTAFESSYTAALTDSSVPLFTYSKDISNHKVTLFIGPEGDFSDNEYQFLRENNVREVSLSKNILRAETAAIYALSVIDQIKN